MNNYSGLQYIVENIRRDIMSEIDRVGIHYRLHARIKDIFSLKEKIERKGKDYYSVGGKKVQDICGFRITTYFIEDVKLLWDIFERKYEKVDETNDVLTQENKEVFKPVRKNLVCRMSKSNTKILQELLSTDNSENIYALIDSTFEIQFRTTLSEGWHEIDHVLRYKCISDWDNSLEEWRMLNGIYATLETSDNTLKSLFDDLSYQHHKKQNWEAMLRTKFRLKFIREPLHNDICEILDKTNELAKNIFRIDRESVIKKISESKLEFPLSFDNLIHLLNFIELKNDAIDQLLPQSLKTRFQEYLTIV